VIYANLIGLLVVILVLATGGVPAMPQLSPMLTAAVVAGKFVLFLFSVRVMARRAPVSPSGYSRLLVRLNLAAIVFFAVDIYLLAIKRFFAALPLAAVFPTVADLAGITFFHVYLLAAWWMTMPLYRRVFQTETGFAAHAARQLSVNLSLILPWIFFSLLYDGLEFLPSGPVRDVIDSWWGGMLFFTAVFLLMAVFFPIALVRLWGCRSLQQGPARRAIEQMLADMGLAVRDICLWPVIEGRALTAGIMGLVRRARFLLVTPALLENLTTEELRAVVAHEYGHVRYRHLWLYLLVFAGFAFLAQALMPVTVYWLLGTDTFYRLVESTGADPGEMLSFLGCVPMFVVLLLYFRYLFGFFMRNFERQADIAALEETGSGRVLAAVLEKIAILAGNIRDEANWHHFGIGERIDFLLRAEADYRVAARHHLKVRAAVVLLVLAMAAGFFLYSRAMPAVTRTDAARFSEAVVRYRMRVEPDNPVWIQSYADFLQDRHREREALAMYEQALALDPDNPDIMNNLAWLLLTSRAPWIRDEKRALELAERAAAISRKGYILDTLALACFVNGRRDEAIRLEDEAIETDPDAADYYRSQKEKFGGGRG